MRRRSSQACEERGASRVYLEHLLGLVEDLHADGRTVQFWGDIVGQHPELIPELPTKGLVCLVWGYEAPVDPETLPPEARERLESLGALEMLRGFGPRSAPFAESGLPFWVCPGTSSWNSLIGRLPNALGNLRDAAEAGLARGASGYLITDWGDNGHLQPPGVSLPALAYGAAVAWCTEANRDLDLDAALSARVLRDPTGELAAALRALGEAYTGLGLFSFNNTAFASALIRPLDRSLPVYGETSRDRLEYFHDRLRDAEARLGRARSGREDAETLVRELRQAIALARHGARRLERNLLGSGPPSWELRRDLERAIEEQARVWRLRSREGGLEDSLARLRRRLADYDD